VWVCPRFKEEGRKKTALYLYLCEDRGVRGTADLAITVHLNHPAQFNRRPFAMGEGCGSYCQKERGSQKAEGRGPEKVQENVAVQSYQRKISWERAERRTCSVRNGAAGRTGKKKKEKQQLRRGKKKKMTKHKSRHELYSGRWAQQRTSEAGMTADKG